jgi:hypothetical protein
VAVTLADCHADVFEHRQPAEQLVDLEGACEAAARPFGLRGRGDVLDVVASLDPDIAILIIEHDMDVVFRFAKEITVLVQGAVFTQGTPEEIMANEQVRAVYLGEEGRHAGARGERHG